MADKYDQQDVEFQAQSAKEKEFLDPATTAVVSSVVWFSFRAIAQSVIGRIGLNVFVKWWGKFKNRGKIDASSPDIPKEEPPASS